MLVHVTITHDATDCPGRRPGEPPELVGPSDKRAELARDLRITSHFVLWGASCLLWAQPEHVTYAVLEAEDVEAVLQYVTAITPPGWRSTAVPVWNLPSQFRLVRNVLMAAGGVEKGALAGDEPSTSPAPKPPEGVVLSETTPLTQLAGDEAPGVTSVGAEPGSGTITRLFQALDAGTDPGAGGTPGSTTSPGGLS